MFKKANIKNTILAALAVATLGTTATTANAEGYIADYEAYVISVEPWDKLNMRKWPASHSRKVGRIPHDGMFVYVQRCIVQPNGSYSDWCKVNYNGRWGWVNKRFLARH